MAPCRQPVACALRFARQSSRRLKNVCRHLIMNHSSPRFVNKATTIEIFGKLRGIATEHFLDHRISGLMMVQYYPTSHQQMWMPCSQIMEQLQVRARHRLRWHRQSAEWRYTWDLQFQKTAIKSTSTMILNATRKSYALVPVCHMVSGLFSGPRNKTVEYGRSTEYWLQHGSQKVLDWTSKNNCTELPKSLWRLCNIKNSHNGSSKTKSCFKSRRTRLLSPEQTVIHGRWMESPNLRPCIACSRPSCAKIARIICRIDSAKSTAPSER